jgi:predicted deacylase
MRFCATLAMASALFACSHAEPPVVERPEEGSPAAVVPPTPPAATPSRRTMRIGAGTELLTDCHVVDSGHEGDVVLVLAGIHGDEPAPPVAAERIAQWSVARGRLLVVPTVNPPALRAGTRHIPGAVPIDLNRQFPGGGRTEPADGMARDIWSLLSRERVTWVLDLHEGWDFHRINRKSVGSSVTYVPQVPSAEASLAMARFVLDAINGAEAPPRHPFELISPGPSRSVARAVSEQQALRSLVIETTKIGQPIDERVAQHERAVREVLSRLGMVGG